MTGPQPITNGAANYNSNRHENWQYDNQGNVLGSYDANFSYDAAGRNNYYSSNVYVNSTPVLQIAQTFDGNSAPSSKTETRIEDPNAPATVKSTYYLRSTVLGGKVAAELTNTGYKRVGHVYAGGMEIATQTIGNPGSGSQVTWTSTNPATGSEYQIFSDGSVGRKELDPLGSDVTFPPAATLSVEEPPFFNSKFDYMPLEYEGGQTADAGVASWYVNNVNKDFDARMANLYWQHGFRDKAQEIVEKNPNVGVQSGGQTYFGREAVNFLGTVPQEPAQKKKKSELSPVVTVTVKELDLEYNDDPVIKVDATAYSSKADYDLAVSPAEVLIFYPIFTNGVESFFGHVAYVINGHVYTWQLHGWDTRFPTKERYMKENSFRAATGYVLDFEPKGNIEFKELLKTGYDGRGYHDLPVLGQYRLRQNNCGEAFCRAMNTMGLGPDYSMSPADHERFILNNLGPYIKATNHYP